MDMCQLPSGGSAWEVGLGRIIPVLRTELTLGKRRNAGPGCLIGLQCPECCAGQREAATLEMRGYYREEDVGDIPCLASW